MLFLAHCSSFKRTDRPMPKARSEATSQGDRCRRQGRAITCILVLLYSSICHSKCSSSLEDASTQTPVLWTACEPTDSKSPIPARVLSGPSLMDAGSRSRSGCLVCVYLLCVQNILRAGCRNNVRKTIKHAMPAEFKMGGSYIMGHSCHFTAMRMDADNGLQVNLTHRRHLWQSAILAPDLQALCPDVLGLSLSWPDASAEGSPAPQFPHWPDYDQPGQSACPVRNRGSQPAASVRRQKLAM